MDPLPIAGILPPMSSFSCPHYDFDHDRCLRLDLACKPSQPGCVLFGKVAVATDRPVTNKRTSRKNPGKRPDPSAEADQRGDCTQRKPT